MKNVISIFAVAILFSSCSLFKKSEKLGCKSDGRNVGAEKILSGDPKYSKDVKAAKKAKYRGQKSY